MKKLILIPILFLSYILNAQYIVVKPSQLPAALTINLTDLFILNQGTTTKKVTYNILNTALKDTFATKSALEDTAAAIRASGSSSTIYASDGVYKDGDTVKLDTIIGTPEGFIQFDKYNKYILLSSEGVNAYSEIFIDSTGIKYGTSIDTTLTTPTHLMTEQQVKMEIASKDGGWRKRADATKYIGSQDSVVIKNDNNSTGEIAGMNYYYQGNLIWKATRSSLKFYGSTKNCELSLGGIYNKPTLVSSENDITAFNFAPSSAQIGMFIKNLDTVKFGRNYYGISSGNDYFYTTKTGSIGIVSNGVRTYEVDSLGVVKDSKPHVALYRNTDLTISATQNVWYKISGFTAKDADLFTVQGDSIQFQKAGSYVVDMTISFSGLNNEVWELAIFKGAEMEEPSQLRYTGTSDVGNMSCPVYMYVTAGQWISFKIRNTTDGDDPTIKRFSARITPVHLSN